MTLNFSKSDFAPLSELVTYNSISRVPLDLKLHKYNMLSETIWCRNLSGENFIEFRFDKKTMRLYQITVIAVEEDTVRFVIDDVKENYSFFECYLAKNSETEISRPINIFRSGKSLSFVWGNVTSINYAVATNCILGVDDQGVLNAVTFINLNEQTISDILRF